MFKLTISQNSLCVEFPVEPSGTDAKAKITAMLESKGFVRDGLMWKRSHSSFWESECRQLAAHCNAQIVEEVAGQLDEVADQKATIPQIQHTIPQIQHTIAQIQQQINSLTAEVNRLKKNGNYDEETEFPSGFDPKGKKMVSQNEDYKYTEFLYNLLTTKIKKKKSPPPRPGQNEFRDTLINLYGCKCLISGCDIEEALEAAHIIPFNGLHSHHLANGLLLRVDLHRLFDNHLLTIHPGTRKVLIDPKLMSSYKDILGKEIEVRLSDEDAIKQKHILEYHCQETGS